MKKGTIEHPKLLLLEAALRITKIEAIGLLEALWHWTARYAPRGDIGKFTDEQIAQGAFWPRKDCDRLIEALVDKRWIDRHEEHRLVVHGWSEHAEDMVRKYLNRTGQTFADGQPPYNKRSSCVTPMSPRRDDMGMTESRQSRTAKMPHARVPSPSPSPSPSPTGSEGDDVHRILMAAPVLACMSFEQDLAARRNAGVAIHDPRLKGWACRAVDKAAELMELEQPGAWWRVRLEEYQGRFFGKKDGGEHERKPRRWNPEERT